MASLRELEHLSNNVHSSVAGFGAIRMRVLFLARRTSAHTPERIQPVRVRTLVCGVAGALAFATAAQAATTFTLTGAPETYTVPAGVSQLRVQATGAQGGGLDTCGYGAAVTATILVTPGQVLTLRVGGRGAAPNGATGAAGGYNGGGSVGPNRLIRAPSSGTRAAQEAE